MKRLLHSLGLMSLTEYHLRVDDFLIHKAELEKEREKAERDLRVQEIAYRQLAKAYDELKSKTPKRDSKGRFTR